MQLVELKYWGESTTGLLHQTVSDHRSMEKAYLEDLLAKRRKTAADKQGLRGQPFRNGAMQMLALAKKEASSGLSLPFGPMVVGSTK